MKQFIVSIIKFVLLFTVVALCIVCFAFGVAAPQFQMLYTGAIADKVERLESIQEPKIILVGNSNLAFGIDSERIEQAFGRPVINLGGHGGLGNQFHYNMAKRNIGDGDIVIVVPTELGEGRIGDKALAWATIENHDAFWEFIPEEDRLEMLQALPQYCIKTIVYYFTKMENEDEIRWYARSAFNEYGDIAYPREAGQMSAGAGTGQVPVVTEQGIDQINQFAEFCQARNAQCLLALYPIMDSEYTASDADFEAFQRELREKIQCEYISDYQDYLMSPEYFLDTQYHLTDEGTAIRTNQLIEDLVKWMEQKQQLCA